MGRIGADLLLNSLLSPTNKPAKEIRIAEDLVVRGSSAPPPAGMRRGGGAAASGGQPSVAKSATKS